MPLFWGAGGSWVPSNTKSPWPRPTSVPSGILIHPDVWPQRTWTENWGLCPLFGGAGSPSNRKVAWAKAYLHIKCHLNPSTTDMGRKLCGSPSNTMWPEPRPPCMLSFILIRPTTIHQRHRQRQDRQTDRQDRQRSDSIG